MQCTEQERAKLDRIAARANKESQTMDCIGRMVQHIGLGHYGIERVECAGVELEYLNRGDTYTATIGREPSGEFVVTSWGDWYETIENRHCEDEGVVRCSYCSEFTPNPGGDWSEITCEHCEHCVSG